MQSDVIAVVADNIAPALDLVEKTVQYVGYPETYGERMRLITEELINSARFVLDETTATLWVDTDAQNMSIHLKLEGALSDATRDRLVELSKCNCNEPPKGLFARIGAFFSDAFMSDAAEYVPLFLDGTEAPGSYYMPISMLSGYHEPAKDSPPDEMETVELSILRGMADDITVCARPLYAEVTVLKKLPERHIAG